MTRAAQTHEVILKVCTALFDRNNMVHFIYRCHSSLTQAPLAQGIPRCVAFSYLFPGSAVFSVHIRRAAVSVIVLSLDRVVSLTVPAALRSQAGTAGEGTRSSWFSRYVSPPSGA